MRQEHDWKISLWSQSISRLSDDLVIPMGDATMQSSVVYTFPLPVADDKEETEEETEEESDRDMATPRAKCATLLLNIECVNRYVGFQEHAEISAGCIQKCAVLFLNHYYRPLDCYVIIVIVVNHALLV